MCLPFPTTVHLQHCAWMQWMQSETHSPSSPLTVISPEPIYYFNKFQSQFLQHHYFLIPSPFFVITNWSRTKRRKRRWRTSRKLIVIDSSIINDFADCFNLAKLTIFMAMTLSGSQSLVTRKKFEIFGLRSRLFVTLLISALRACYSREAFLGRQIDPQKILFKGCRKSIIEPQIVNADSPNTAIRLCLLIYW